MADILFLTQVLPYPLNSGAKVRAYYVLRHLAQNHRIWLVSFVRATDDDASADHLRKFCHAVYTVPMVRSAGRTAGAALRSLWKREPIIVERDEIPAMYRLLERIMADQTFDYVHADQTSMVRYALWAKDHGPAGDDVRDDASDDASDDGSNGSRPTVAVLDAHNALFKVVQRLADDNANPIVRNLLQREARLLIDYESDAYGRFDHVVFVTREDQAEFSLPSSHVIPICRDVLSAPPVGCVANPTRITFVGPLHWPPNVEGVRWFLEEIWPQIVREQPGAILTIIGVDPPADLSQVGGSAANIEVTGYVDDLTPYLAETAVFVVPLLAGGGMRVKIIDAWMWALPVVSTSIGAEGIAIEEGDNLLIADTPSEFAHDVLRLLDDSDLAAHLRRSGRTTVESRYDWRRVYGAWDQVYDGRKERVGLDA